MLRPFRSFDEARLTFEQYARIEPRLTALWRMCRRAAPPVPVNDQVEDAFDADVFDLDVFAVDKPSDGWCAEDLFFQNIKPTLVSLVGWNRTEGPPELRGSDAYDTVYSALFHHALYRPCACCRERQRLLRMGGRS